MIIYGLMKFIEQIPSRYDRMIGFLTFGGHRSARRRMLARVKPGVRVLDIGCGTGKFLLEAARHGAICTGVDASRSMLAVFREKLASEPDDIASRVTLLNHSATLLEKSFAGETFDIITASLMLGELPPLVLTAVLGQIPQILAPGGSLLIADELWPKDQWRSMLYSFIMAVTFIPNFILTRTMIRPVKGLEERLSEAGFEVMSRRDFAFGVVSLIEAVAKKTT
ncbi:MAG: methyltransferase domain-containing protein [Candidatus Riflebacteria bacterium]|nr:methyltransferase domain-containing protein [Candidatus Riflebacteria bacterium]